MSLIAEDRQGQAREKEHSKHSSRKRHSRVTEAEALVIGCPDMKALLVALPFLESQFSVLPYKDSCAPDTLAISSVPRAHQAHFHHRAFAFAPLLSWKSFSLRTCHDRGLLILYVSVQMSNAQRGHL